MRAACGAGRDAIGIHGGTCTRSYAATVSGSARLGGRTSRHGWSLKRPGMEVDTDSIRARNRSNAYRRRCCEPRIYGPALNGPEPGSEVPQERRLRDNLEAADLVAAVVHFENRLHQIIDVALGVDAARDS